MLPKPVQSPCPIWLTTNAGRLRRTPPDRRRRPDFALRRVGRVADGWMTHSVTPEGFPALPRRDRGHRPGRRAGRWAGSATSLPPCSTSQDDAEVAMADAKGYLDLYYGANFRPSGCTPGARSERRRPNLRMDQTVSGDRLSGFHLPARHQRRCDEPIAASDRGGAAAALTGSCANRLAGSFCPAGLVAERQWQWQWPAANRLDSQRSTSNDAAG